MISLSNRGKSSILNEFPSTCQCMIDWSSCSRISHNFTGKQVAISLNWVYYLMVSSRVSHHLDHLQHVRKFGWVRLPLFGIENWEFSALDGFTINIYKKCVLITKLTLHFGRNLIQIFQKRGYRAKYDSSNKLLEYIAKPPSKQEPAWTRLSKMKTITSS